MSCYLIVEVQEELDASNFLSLILFAPDLVIMGLKGEVEEHWGGTFDIINFCDLNFDIFQVFLSSSALTN